MFIGATAVTVVAGAVLVLGLQPTTDLSDDMWRYPWTSTGAFVAFSCFSALLHGLASCITAGIGNIAAARGVTLTSVESQIEGDIDLQGILGLSETVRNGYERIRISFTIAGDAPAEKLREIVEQSRARSAVFDVLTNGVPVEMTVNAR